MLTVNEIFHSIQGESTFAGEPCVFVRLTACDLRCSWCDTAYAFYEGRKMSVDEVLREVERYNCPTVEVTGGEPLLQRDVYPLMSRLLESGKTVLLETGGHRSIDEVPPGVIRIVDVKCPGSGESEKMDWDNLKRLTAIDQVKFVIKDRADYEFARDIVNGVRVTHPPSRQAATAEHVASPLRDRVAAVLFSPVHGVMDARELAAWILADRLPVRLQLQAHKFIWGADVRGV